jgi:hypothetical protein
MFVPNYSHPLQKLANKMYIFGVFTIFGQVKELNKSYILNCGVM